MPTTASGIIYPASSANTQLWTHFQTMADSIETPLASLIEDRHLDVTRTTTQSITHNSTSYISFNSEIADTHGYITVTSDTITIPTGAGGVYCISAYARYAANATGFRVLGIEVAGSVVAEWRGLAHTTGGQPTSMGASIGGIRLAQTNTIKLLTFQNSGGALNTEASTPRLHLLRVAA